MAFRVLLAALLVSFTPALTQADPITVTFTAFPSVSDPVNTHPSSGSFTFESSLIPPDGGQVLNASGLGVTEINFPWGHTVWTRANADVSELQFNASGELLAFVLGGTPSGGGGIYGFVVAPASAVVDDIFVTTFVGVGGTSGITYTNAGYEGWLAGTLTTRGVAAPTPEPASVILLGGALAVACARRLRRSVHQR